MPSDTDQATARIFRQLLIFVARIDWWKIQNIAFPTGFGVHSKYKKQKKIAKQISCALEVRLSALRMSTCSRKWQWALRSAKKTNWKIVQRETEENTFCRMSRAPVTWKFRCWFLSMHVCPHTHTQWTYRSTNSLCEKQRTASRVWHIHTGAGWKAFMWEIVCTLRGLSDYTT